MLRNVAAHTAEPTSQILAPSSDAHSRSNVPGSYRMNKSAGGKVNVLELYKTQGVSLVYRATVL
jgi:aconitase B